ncbi:RDD family protein [Flavobacterium rhizosphaerae]|uniref:RDD family protein n=1 Tax=Flavobacterium rhizosphaerae TaxID=3163298 RepID=A0ABW8YZ13_9FLAO
MIITSELYANGSKRLANYIIDRIVMFVIDFCFISVLGYIYDEFYAADWILYFISDSIIANLAHSCLFSVVYYTIFEATTQRTVGKFITGTKVVMEDGSKPGWRVIIIRSLCRMIPFDAFSFLGSNARGWHDSLSSTYVVVEKEYAEAAMLKDEFDQIGVNTDQSAYPHN